MSLPRTGLGTTSLGAVGGARGTAAGGLRILVEFLTQYDSAAVKQLERDLDDLTSQSDAASRKSLSAAKAVETANKKADQLAAERKRVLSRAADPAAARRDFQAVQNAGTLTKLGQERLKALDTELGKSGSLSRIVTQEANIRRGLPGLMAKANNAAAEAVNLAKQQVGTQKELQAFQNLRSSVAPRLGGLALGAVGGIFGGAVVGLGFAAAQAAIDAIGQGLLDIVDPARHARDAIKDVGDAVNALRDSQENAGDANAAAAEYLKSIGVAADEASTKLLAQYAIDVKVKDAVASQKEVIEANTHADAVRKQNIEDITQNLIAEAKANGDLHFELTRMNKAKGETINLDGGIVDVAYYKNIAITKEIEIEKQLADVYAEAARAAYNKANAERAAAAAAQLAAFAEEQLVGAISGAAATRTAGIDSQISAVQASGPSAKTRRLQNQIDKAQSGGGGNNNQQAQLREERAILLLKQRLALMGTAINLERYSGKFLLAAIDAKLKAMQKEADAQDRLNKLLDLQYKESQVLRRNEGENIQDFIERRAQENRSNIQERQKLEDEAAKAHLEDLRDKTQIEVDLANNAEAMKNAAAAAGASARMKLLQKELAASQKADEEARKAKIAALEAQKKALQQAAADAEKYAVEAKNVQIREAISAAKTVGDLQKLQGNISGLNAAYGFINGLLTSGAVSGPEATRLREALARIKNTLGQYDAKFHNIVTGHGVGRGPTERDYAEGGLIKLNNASSPFGSNVRFGEEGTEYGLILQHSIAKTLRGTARNTGQVGPFYVGKTDDWLRDKYDLKRAVSDAMDEALQR